MPGRQSLNDDRPVLFSDRRRLVKSRIGDCWFPTWHAGIGVVLCCRSCRKLCRMARR
ncbi:hypothetical protein F8B43_2157 [Methylorubrum populi]|uniref:Uncharacterized protein n=1 Tax=Methylorubrum populi TaxID=223967 RepID=A0A833J9A2_9HYPH|nr:hypothetical protein F8B43_2157 [Methylorubrum populi]